MDKLATYQQLIKQIMSRYVADFANAVGKEVPSFLVTDDAHGHYIWLDLGWTADRRINRPVVQVRLQNGKFWIEEDFTEEGIANELMAAGVPKEDIVLAFHAPDMRPYTGFAVA